MAQMKDSIKKASARNIVVIVAAVLAIAVAIPVVMHFRKVAVQAGADETETVESGTDYNPSATVPSEETSTTIPDVSQTELSTIPDVTGTTWTLPGIRPPVSTTKAAIIGAVRITSLKITPSTMVMNKGESRELSVKVEPANAANEVTWTSNKPNIATVDDAGNVKGISAGVAHITCTAKDGSRKSDTTTVSVVADQLTREEIATAELFSYMFNPDGNFFYTSDEPWQRQFGFNLLYDLGAPLAGMFYNTVRVKFKYNDLDWMVQLWKGQYGFLFIGSEIGVYTKPEARTTNHYDCATDENSLKMQMTLYDADKLLFTRDYAKSWWMTGFVPGKVTRFSNPTGLTVLARITLKSPEMTAAFTEAFAKCGFKKADAINRTSYDSYKVIGNDVYFNWKYIKHSLTD